MGAGWTECSYCKADAERAETAAQGRRATVAETPGAASGPRRVTVVERSPAPPPRPSPVPSPLSPPLRSPLPPPFAKPAVEPHAGPEPGATVAERKTVFYAQPDGQRSETGGVPQRRIVGLLITYSHRPEGQIFPVREGRNLIGRDPQQCEIALPEDSTLSSINSHITFRKSFMLGDNVSMGGTDLNGEPVEEQFRPLPNYSHIRTGSTHWIFIMVEP